MDDKSASRTSAFPFSVDARGPMRSLRIGKGQSGPRRHTAVTQAFTGRLGRGIDNELLQTLNKPGTEVPPYPLQRALMRSLALRAQKADRPDLLALCVGQSTNFARRPGITELLQSLVDGAAHRLNRI